MADEIEVSVGTLDVLNQLAPTYELWAIRREAWLPSFPFDGCDERNRESEGRFEGRNVWMRSVQSYRL